MPVHIDMRSIMLDAQCILGPLADEMVADANIARVSSDNIQRRLYAESCVENMKRLRDKLNELLAQAEQAAHREAA